MICWKKQTAVNMNCARSMYNVPTYSAEHGLSKKWAENMDLRTGKNFFQFISWTPVINTKMAKMNMYLFSVRYLNRT